MIMYQFQKPTVGGPPFKCHIERHGLKVEWWFHDDDMNFSASGTTLTVGAARREANRLIKRALAIYVKQRSHQ